MRFGWMIGAAVLIAAAGGCSTADKPSSQSQMSNWTEPTAYHFTLTRGCDAGKPLGRWTVKVADGALTNDQRLDQPDVQPTASDDPNLGPLTKNGEEINVPTLKQLLDITQDAHDDGNPATVTSAAEDGHPEKITFTSDGRPECFAITDYAGGA